MLCFGRARERLTWKRRDLVPRCRRIGIIHTGCGCLMIKRDWTLRTWVRSVWWTWICRCNRRLRAFDDKLPLTRMLPGSNPCELRLLLPDSKIGTDGFHDVVTKNLSASPTWRSSHVMPGSGVSTSFHSSSTRVGIPPQRARILLNLPR